MPLFSRFLKKQSPSDQPNIIQPVVFNFGWLSLTELISRLLKFFLFIFAARVLGVNGFGVFSFCLNLIALVVLLADFGLFNTSVREFSREPALQEKVGAFVFLKIILSTVVFLIIIGLSLIPYSSRDIPSNLILLGFYLIFENLAQTFFAYFRAQNKIHYEAYSRILEILATVLFGFLFLSFWPKSFILSLAYFLGALICFLFTLFLYFKNFNKFKIEKDRPLFKKLLSLSWPVAFLAVFYSLYHSMDSVMLGFWGFISENGLYNAAYKIADILILPTVLLTQSFYPIISRYHIENDRLKNLKLLKLNFISSGFLGFFLSLIVFAFSYYFILFLYGQNYLPATSALRILMLVNSLIYLSYPLYQWLISQNRQKISFFIALSGVVLNFCLNLLLIPRYTFIGAAWATFFTYLWDLALTAYFVWQIAKKQ